MIACKAFKSVRGELLEIIKAEGGKREAQEPPAKRCRRQRARSGKASSPAAASPAGNNPIESANQEMMNSDAEEASDWQPSSGEHARAGTGEARQLTDTASAPVRALNKPPVSSSAALASSRAKKRSAGPQSTPARTAPVPAEPPPGCGVCPVCHRTFGLKVLQQHVESCLSGAGRLPKHAVGAAATEGVPTRVIDVTCSPGTPPPQDLPRHTAASPGVSPPLQLSTWLQASEP